MFVNVRLIRDCCLSCHTLTCGNGHAIGKWSERAANDYQPHLFYLNPAAIATAWTP